MVKKRILNIIFFTSIIIAFVFLFCSIKAEKTVIRKDISVQSPLIKFEEPFDILVDNKVVTEHLKITDRLLIFNKPVDSFAFRFRLPHYTELDGFTPFMFMQSSNSEISAYFGDTLIYTRRYHTEKQMNIQTYEGVVNNFIELPSNYWEEDVTIVLNYPVAPIDRYQTGSIYLGNEATIRLHGLERGFMGLSFGFMMFLIGAVILFVMFLNRRTRNFNLVSLALFIINLGIWLISQSQANFIFTDNSATVVSAAYFALFSLPAFTIYLLNSYYIIKKNKFYIILENISLYSLPVLGFLYFLTTVSSFSMKTLLIPYGAYVLIFELTVTVYLTITMIKRNNKELTNPILALVCILVSIILDEAFLILEISLTSAFSFFLLYIPYLIAAFILLQDIIRIYIQEQQKVFTKEILYDIYSKDSLSGAYTRSYFEAELKNKTLRIPYESHVFFIDINDMKKINDQEGHAAGDTLIKSIGQAVRMLFSNQKTKYLFVRYGGDEFICIIYPDDIAIDQELFRSKLEEYFRIYCSQKTTLSVGYSVLTVNKTIKTAIAEADEMMLTEKKFKKNCKH